MEKAAGEGVEEWGRRWEWEQRSRSRSGEVGVEE